MQPGQPSFTALRAAAHRAQHQTLDGGSIFADPVAGRILGQTPESVFGEAGDSPSRRGMRLLIAARSRIAEDALAAAHARGARQYVVLGAGLDSFACRNPHPDLTVFEVDHPATQAWKRERLDAAGLAPKVTFAPTDFERETLAEGLARAGFDTGAPAVFAWLGVVPYLTREAVLATFAFIATIPGAEVVFDHGEPRSAYPADQQAAAEARLAAMRRLGEPWITFFTPPEIAAELTALGFSEVEDFGPAVLGPRFLGTPPREGPGPHVVRAKV